MQNDFFSQRLFICIHNAYIVSYLSQHHLILWGKCDLIFILWPNEAWKILALFCLCFLPPNITYQMCSGSWKLHLVLRFFAVLPHDKSSPPRESRTLGLCGDVLFLTSLLTAVFLWGSYLWSTTSLKYSCFLLYLMQRTRTFEAYQLTLYSMKRLLAW